MQRHHPDGFLKGTLKPRKQLCVLSAAQPACPLGQISTPQHNRVGNITGVCGAPHNAGFHHLYGNGAIYEVACWAHARRKFQEIHAIHASPTTTEALVRIGALYAIEEEIRGKPADLRSTIRQTRARPLLDELRKWMERSLHSLSPKSETAGAIRNALSRWHALTRYTDDGRLEIDNNAAERALRTVALGRNYVQFSIMRSVLGRGRWMAAPMGAVSVSRNTDFT